MQAKLYVALSGQLAMERRLATIANNIANQGTAGYRAEETAFASLVSETGEDPVAFASRGDSHISRRGGEIVHTGNPLDIAVSGEGWLAIATPSGTVLTRDGRLEMTPTGELKTVTGFAVLDVGGAPIQLDPGVGPPAIARDGTITQGGRQIGAVGLFALDPEARLTRAEGAAVISDRLPVPQLDFNRVAVAQGYIERSNVDPVKELTRLIALQRSFDAVSATINDAEGTISEAIRALGG